jgi:hypothetical protein
MTRGQTLPADTKQINRLGRALSCDRIIVKES